MKILVTGGAGFIGSNFIRYITKKRPEIKIINLDKLSYAGNLGNLKDINNISHKHVKADIVDKKIVGELMKGMDAVIHFAAESHVTRSENDSDVFYKTNVLGTKVLLEAAKKAGVKRFVHISTDEVYGSKEKGFFKEDDKERGDHQASSHYSKSKSQADDLAISYSKDLEIVIVRPTNNFGPYQYPEKALPRWIARVLNNKPIPVWGQGDQVRDWLYVEDTARAIWKIFEEGQRGHAYNVAANNIPELTNKEVAELVCETLGVDKNKYIKFIPDPRPDHDFRYALDTDKIKKHIDWSPSKNSRELIRETVIWYKENVDWWKDLLEEAEEIYKDIE